MYCFEFSKMNFFPKFRTKILNLSNIRLVAKKAVVKKEETTPKSRKPKHVSNEITTYFKRKNAEILEKFPNKLLRKKKRSPDNFYINDLETAISLSKVLKPKNSVEFIEVNPGLGILTKQLLQDGLSKVHLIEGYETFVPHLEKISSNFPGRITMQTGDFGNIHKLAYQDKLDDGNRVSNLFGDIKRREYTDDIGVRLYAGTGNINLIKHLINSLVFQISLHNFGRIEMFLLMPPPLYIHLTCSNELGYLFYRSTSILFQIMFEYKYIAKFPRKHFLPWQFEYDLSKTNKLTRINIIDPEWLYLVRIVPRKNLYELVAPEDIQALWYFIKQNCTSRRNRIIPALEKLVPGCGPRLIINLKEIKQAKQLYSDETKNNLPPFSMPCTTITNHDFYSDMNIFTQFGDLSPMQLLTLFNQFRNWPEYKECTFLDLLQTSLLKMESSDSDNVDGIELPEEEDDGQVEINEALHSEHYIKKKSK